MRSPSEKALYEMVIKWEGEVGDPRDAYPFRALLDELLFHGRLRYDDYLQYREDGVFPVRLLKWLENVHLARDKRTLMQMLAHLIFIDAGQFMALHRDAYRRIIVPWICPAEWSLDDYLSADYSLRLRGLVRRFLFFSVTESFGGADFIKVNDLSGIPKFQILGERVELIQGLLPPCDASIEGLIILEDFIGTGKQAARILKTVVAYSPKHWRILFVPLIALEVGAKRVMDEVKLLGSTNLTFQPVEVLPGHLCLREKPSRDEPRGFPAIRSLVKKVSPRVSQKLNEFDDVPTNPFGYQGCGAIFVSAHNAPNNTLPLIHHKSPAWVPLFRRVHHAKGDINEI